MLPQSTPLTPIPELTIRVAQAAFPKGNTFIFMRDTLGTIFTDLDFAELFSERGQPALSPWRLALVTIMQFVAGMVRPTSRRGCAESLRWKYALSLELTDPGFDFWCYASKDGEALSSDPEPGLSKFSLTLKC